MQLNDTIIANSACPASSTGGGVRAILRLSGPRAMSLVRTLVALPEDAGAGYHGPLAIPLLHPALKAASVLLFKGPRSFTGENVAELHMPNSPALIAACIDRLLEGSAGEARLAGPGEFSARAFFNGKIDLTEAEGIAATINATTELELRAAASLREGALHKRIHQITGSIAEALALVEAGIDFADEEGISFVSAAKLHSTLDQLAGSLDELLVTALRIDRIDVPPTVVFIGKPNVGKSSLINALAAQERSIVSPVAGTTRDILAATMRGTGGDVRLLDVPGEEAPSDDLRAKMMEVRRLAILEADIVIRVIDTAHFRDETNEWFDMSGNHFNVRNKIDLLAELPDETDCWPPAGGAAAPVSARTGFNIEKLRELILRFALRKQTLGHGRLALNQRHRVILQDAKAAMWNASLQAVDEEVLRRHPELLAADLRRALDLLGQITGTISPDDVLGLIFSRFCIGK